MSQPGQRWKKGTRSDFLRDRGEDQPKEYALAVRTRAVLPLASDRDSPSMTRWFQRTPESGDRIMGVSLVDDLWIDMGSPESITVTVEPGELLNETKLSAESALPQPETRDA